MEQSKLRSEFDGALFEKIKDIFPPEEANLALRAHAFAANRLKSGGNLAVKVAKLLLDHKADIVSITVALLVPGLWGESCTLHEIKENFGIHVAEIIKDLSFPNTFRNSPGDNKHQVTQSLLESFAGEPRKALLKLALRLAELENALEKGADGWRNVAQETLDLYVPIAYRLGFGELCNRLEDVSFHLANPLAYDNLRQGVAPIQAEDEKCLEILKDGIRRLLKRNGIKGDVQGRTKSLYSIYRKVIRKGSTLDSIMDRIGMRIIVATVPECYAVLGFLHSHFKPVPGAFDDYIGLPKENGYQSLHTCVYPVRDISGKPIEFQIRTRLMHLEAEYGTAAHWQYKCAGKNSSHGQEKSRWLENLVFQHQKASSEADFFELLKRQVYIDALVVFGKGGQIARLPENATVKDYLNRYYPNYAPELPVKVNEEWVFQDHKLRDGDSIEVLAQEDGAPSFSARKIGEDTLREGDRTRENGQLHDGSLISNSIFLRETTREV